MRFDSKWIHRLTTSLPAPTGKLPVPNKTAAVTIAAVAAGAALWWLSSAPPAPAPTPPAAPAETPEPAQAQPLIPADLPARPDPNTSPQLPAIPQPVITSDTALPEPTAIAEPDDQAEAAAPDPQELQPRRQPWIVLDATRYPLNVQVVDHYTALPQPYTWPLPDFDELELICYDSAEHAHLGILEAPDGRLFNWGEERRFLLDDLERDQIDSSELATIAFPGAFLKPLRAAAHAVCAQAHEDRRTEADD